MAVSCDHAVLRYPGTPAPAVEDFCLDVAVGEGVVITGMRGSGTSAVAKALTGLLRPLSGSVEVFGLRSDDPRLRPRVGYCPERTPFPDAMTVREATRVVAGIRGVDHTEADAALVAAGLHASDRRRVGRLAIEDVRRLCLACALVGDPDLLVLDDPWEFPETVDALRDARERGATIVVATLDPGGFGDLVGPVVTLPGGGLEEGI